MASASILTKGTVKTWGNGMDYEKMALDAMTEKTRWEGAQAAKLKENAADKEVVAELDAQNNQTQAKEAEETSKSFGGFGLVKGAVDVKKEEAATKEGETKKAETDGEPKKNSGFGGFGMSKADGETKKDEAEAEPKKQSGFGGFGMSKAETKKDDPSQEGFVPPELRGQMMVSKTQSKT